ncbi:MAG TPA: cytochrome c peroxidase [Gemmatimonadaceae bacterium]
MRTRSIVMVLLAGSVACGRSPAPATNAAEEGSAPAVTQAQLSMFAPLPARMVAGEAPAEPMVALGRALYYENILSENHDVSCNSCHPLNAYGADGRALSVGDRGQLGGRNAPTVYNAAGHIAQFWDGRAKDVEAQAKGPILNPAEMAMSDSAEVLAHLRASPAYRAAFREAFPGASQPVTYDNVGRAIGAFERGLVTPSRWDRYLTGDSTALDARERRGLATFVAAGCVGCHNGAYVGGQSYQKLGLRTAWSPTADSGRFAVTKSPADVRVFKVAALRNVEKTGPYFHDGSVASLRTAVQLMAKHQLGRDLGDRDVDEILAWLGALTGELPTAYIAYPQKPAQPAPARPAAAN